MVMSAKFSTQTWSKAAQESSLRPEKANYTPATKPAEEENSNKGSAKSVGETLNEIANPGGKSPLATQRRRTNGTMDKDDFLKLMLTQMKNQDPMNPMQSHEMAAQLAQFTSLEQLHNVNTNLEKLQRGQEPVQKFEALNFLGKAIKADTRQIFHSEKESNDLRFNLGNDAVKAKITITDEQGKTVREIEMGGLKKGANKITWNGLDAQERDVKAGRYMFNVEAVGSNSNKVAVLTETAGVITGINYTSEGPMLLVGDQRVRIQDVQRIEDSSLKDTQEKRETQTLAPSGGDGQTVDGDVVRAVVTPQKFGAVSTAGTPSSSAPSASAAGQQAYRKPKVKPETKPEVKLPNASIPLEVTSNAVTPGADQGSIKTGGAFASR